MSRASHRLPRQHRNLLGWAPALAAVLAVSAWLSPTGAVAAGARPHVAVAYYVGGSGSDTQDGRSPATAFRTLQRAADLTGPGDTVYAMNGTYTNTGAFNSVLFVGHSGTAAAWIRYQAMPGQTPRISFNGSAGVSFASDAAYVEVNGFTIIGNNDHVTLAGALARPVVYNPAYDGNGISVDGRDGVAPNKPHHLRIVNNIVGKCGSSGIQTIQSDYVTISGNTVYDSAWYTIYDGSGISTYQNWDRDNAPGYKMVISGNRLFGNKNLVPFLNTKRITDGEGVIIDDSRNTQFGSKLPPYKGRTLIANNLAYSNGSSAFEVFSSDHVDVVNNTSFNNVKEKPLTGRGEFSVNDASDVTARNNIFSSRRGENPFDLSDTALNVTLDFNVYFGGAVDLARVGPNDINGVKPKFVSPQANNRFVADFRLLTGDRAIDSGTTVNVPGTDFAGAARPQGGGVDRGAYER